MTIKRCHARDVRRDSAWLTLNCTLLTAQQGRQCSSVPGVRACSSVIPSSTGDIGLQERVVPSLCTKKLCTFGASSNAQSANLRQTLLREPVQ